MLTETDLKEITKIIDERVPKIVDDIVTKRLRQELKPIKQDISKMRKDIDAIISFFDREYVELRQRVARIEEHLGLPPLQL